MFHKSCFNLILSNNKCQKNKNCSKHIPQRLQTRSLLSFFNQNILDREMIFLDNHYIIEPESDENKRDIEKKLYNLNEIKYDSRYCDMCVICLDKFNKNEEIVLLDCEHNYHKNCIQKWLYEYNNKCPMCNLSIN